MSTRFHAADFHCCHQTEATVASMKCLLLREERTSIIRCFRSPFDPFRTSTNCLLCVVSTAKPSAP